MTATPGPFRTAETHLSWLIMVGDRVLKAKKPVRTKFVDLTTRAEGEDVAEREVRLNRRLAPEAYIGVARLAAVAGLDGHVVVMRRMPDDRRLALLAAEADDLRNEIGELDETFLLDDGPRVPDCLEYDDQLHCGDVLTAIAFLAMDLERPGRPELGALLLAEWPALLADHRITCRAQVRAKAARLRAELGDESAAQRAFDLKDLAEQHLLRAQVRIVVVGGGCRGPASARESPRQRSAPAGPSFGATSCVSNVPSSPGSAGSVLDQGSYAPDVSARVLSDMLAEAETLCGVRCTSCWTRPSPVTSGQAAEDLAVRTGSDITLWTVLPDAAADQRLRARTAEGRDASEATAEPAPALRR